MLALFCAAVALRLWLRIDYNEDIDSLRFALGVERFSPGELRPHAPFYPVYIAAAKVVAALGASTLGALGVVSALSGAAVVALTALLALEVSGRRAAYVAGALALASPFLWVSSQKLMSDMPGVAATTAGLWLCSRARRLEACGVSRAAGVATNGSVGGDSSLTSPLTSPLTGGRPCRLRTAALVMLGIGLGVRLSYFPVAIACAAIIARREGGVKAAFARAGDVCVGVMLWLAPLVAVTPARDLVRTTFMQGIGHFTRWGGTALTVSSPIERAGGTIWGIWANVLGGAWPDAPWPRWIAAPIVVGLFAVFVWGTGAIDGLRRLVKAQPELAASLVAYFVWAALAQNTAYKPRHWLPLAPVLIVGLSIGADALMARARWGVLPTLILGAVWVTDGAALARAHVSPSPAAAIVGFLEETADRDGRRVVTRDLAQMIAVGAPGRAVVRVASEEALLTAVKEAGDAGALITTEALSAAARDALLADGYTLQIAFAAPRSRYIDPLFCELSLLSVARTQPARARAAAPLTP